MFILESPGIPSIFVSYAKANDLYFSGHTGCLTIFLFGHIYNNLKKRTILITVILIYTMFFLLVTNVHYTNDIIIGFCCGFSLVTVTYKYRYNLHILFL